MSNRLVIIGGGQAAFACAAKLRALGDKRPVTILSSEAALPYQRPPLSKKYLLGEMSLDRLMFRPAEWFTEHDVDVRMGVSALSIDREARGVKISDGDDIEYANLAFATGSSPRTLPDTVTAGLEGVFTVRNYADADRLRPVMTEGRSLLVIGGGYIGLEAAAVARKLGMAATVVEMADRILARVAAPETSRIFRDIHLAHGVEILEGVGLLHLEGENGKVTGAQLTGGISVKADVVIVGIGAFAEDKIARDAGLACDNGILVDENGRTSDPLIFAMGDCAAQLWKGRRVRLESVQNAVDQADVVAENLAGIVKAYEPKPWFWSDQYDVKLQIAGFNIGYDETMLRPGGREGASSVWYFQDGDLVAVDAVNDAKAYVVGKKLLDTGKVKDLRAAIADPASDLKSLI